MMVRPFWLIGLLLAGCSSTPAELEEKAAPTTLSYSENYQEIYGRVTRTARRCLANNLNGIASIAVDAELFPDLGYGEMSVSMINMGTRNYYVTTRVDKQPAGSKLTIRAGNTMAASSYTEKVTRWASGDQNC